MAQAKAKAKTKTTKAPTASTGTAATKRTPAKKPAAGSTTASTTTREPKKPSATSAKKGGVSTKGVVDTTAELSDDVLQAVESGQRAAIDAVHRFLETVDEALPALGERPSRREKVIDAALEMADRLTTTQYEFLRTVVRSAEKSLGTSQSEAR
jgi:hypothetical protein